MVGLKDSNDESSCDVEYHILPVDISHITQTSFNIESRGLFIIRHDDRCITI